MPARTDGRWTMTRTMTRPCVRSSVREARASVGLGRRVRSFVRACVRASRNGTERAGRVFVGEDVVVVSSSLVFKSFLRCGDRRTRDDDGARMVRRRR